MLSTLFPALERSAKGLISRLGWLLGGGRRWAGAAGEGFLGGREPLQWEDFRPLWPGPGEAVQEGRLRWRPVMRHGSYGNRT